MSQGIETLSAEAIAVSEVSQGLGHIANMSTTTPLEAANELPLVSALPDQGSHDVPFVLRRARRSVGQNPDKTHDSSLVALPGEPSQDKMSA